jgi:hypothetical protein
VAFSFSESATWLAILFYALARGGPTEAGAVAVVQLVPCVVVAPFAAYAGDRFAPHSALAMSYGLQSVSMAITAVGMAADVPLVAYAAGAATATCITFTRPVMGSLLPRAMHTPGDLVAANVALGLSEQIGVLAGPLAAGALLVWSSPSAVFVVGAVTTAVGAVLAATVEPLEPFRRDAALDASSVIARAFAGFATLRRERAVRAIVFLGAVSGFVAGVADVLFVSFVDLRLGGGGGRAGLLAAAFGVGAVAGAVAVTELMHGRTLRRQFLLAGAVAGLPLVALAGVDGLGAALACLAVVGAGKAVLQLTSTITLQRHAPPLVLSRVFGILEGLVMAFVAAGSLAVALLIDRTSITNALVVLGASVVVAVGVGVLLFARAGEEPATVDEGVVARLVADPVFAALPAPTIERLARATCTRHVGRGDVVVRQGETGDRSYYLICSGRFDVSVNGHPRRQLGDGGAFGEIALLRDVARTATVTAATEATLLVVPRADFLEAVTGHPRSLSTAEGNIERWLA